MKQIIFMATMLLMISGCGSSGGSGDTTTANQLPIANAGVDQSTAMGAVVSLDATASSAADGLSLTYSWVLSSKPGASLASLDDTTLATPIFTADTIGAYSFELTVSDASSNSEIDTVVITVWNNTGTLDSNFDTDGVLIYDLSNSDGGNDVITDSAGNIYVVGRSDDGVNADMTLWKYNSVGELDNSFANNGIAVHDNAAGGSGSDYGNSLVLDNMGNIYVVGYSYNLANNEDLVVWKYTSQGNLDTTFSNAGLFVLDSVSGGASDTDKGLAIAIDKENNLFVTGYSDNEAAGGDDLIVLKITSDGVLDNSFATNGLIIQNNIADTANRKDRGYDIALDDIGNIYVTGYSINASNNNDMIIVKYNKFGVLDTGFGTNGFVVHDSAAGGGDDDEAYGITLDTSGNIYVAGQSYGAGNDDMVIWKYNSDGILDTSFNGSGFVVIVDIAGGSGTDVATSIEVDTGGNVYVSGYSKTSVNFAMVVLKYTSNGTLDTDFGTNGVVIRDDELGNVGHDFARGAYLDKNGSLYVTGTTNKTSGSAMVVWKFN